MRFRQQVILEEGPSWSMRVSLDGFLPFCDSDALPVKHQGPGIREIGLAYESDPAITRHLAGFLSRQWENEDDDRILPDAVLFNGGVMKAPLMRQRVMQVFGDWLKGGTAPTVREISSGDYDLAVARGAVYYGLAGKGRGIRIRSGAGERPLPRAGYQHFTADRGD